VRIFSFLQQEFPDFSLENIENGDARQRGIRLSSPGSSPDVLQNTPKAVNSGGNHRDGPNRREETADTLEEIRRQQGEENSEQNGSFDNQQT
jgi:hypothetical protein